MGIPDRAAAAATAALSIVESSSSSESARLRVAAYLREEFADVARQVAADRRRDDD